MMINRRNITHILIGAIVLVLSQPALSSLVRYDVRIDYHEPFNPLEAFIEFGIIYDTINIVPSTSDTSTGNTAFISRGVAVVDHQITNFNAMLAGVSFVESDISALVFNEGSRQGHDYDNKWDTALRYVDGDVYDEGWEVIVKNQGGEVYFRDIDVFSYELGHIDNELAFGGRGIVQQSLTVVPIPAPLLLLGSGLLGLVGFRRRKASAIAA